METEVFAYLRMGKMKDNLYIFWQDSFIQDESIIDEQHRALLATVNSLHYFLQQGQRLDLLMPTVKILVNYLRFHHKTEEGILRSADYPKLNDYIHNSEEKIKNVKLVCKEALIYKEPEQVLLFLRKWWQEHIRYHDELTLYLTHSAGGYCHIE